MVTTNEPNIYETGVLDSNAEGNFVYTTLDAAINWIRKNSLWPMPMGLSCCAIEFMAVACSRYDLSRFGSEVTRFSPRQADVMIVAGTVTYKMALAVRRIWDQMPEPKWCIAMGACASTGGMFRSYSVLQGVDKILPVDVYISGCPPRPEAILEALLTLRKVYACVSTFIRLPLDPFAASVRYTMPTRKTRERSKRVYTLDEALGVLDALHGNPLEPAFILACFGSCRSGESLGVRTEEVLRWERSGTVLASADICRQMQQSGTEPVGALKTAKSARTVVILPQAADRLVEIAASRAAEGREWLSDRGDGLPMNRSICNNRWRKLCAARGIEHIPWSNLRNSWRTIAEVELRLPWDLIEMLMGHALPGVSGRHYIRPTAEQVVRAAFDALGIS